MNFDPLFDYGFSDLTRTDNLICWKFGELIKTLITLSSEADRQVEIIGFGCAADEMAEEFGTYFTLSYKAFVENGLLNESTNAKLNAMNHFFSERSGKDIDFWDDTKLSTNKDWQDVRMQANEILILLGFENLDITFERTEEYKKSKEGKELLLQTTRSRLVKK